jgi:hypothetical protein
MPKLDVPKIAGIAAEASVRYGINVSNMLAGLVHPRVVLASIKRAPEPDGVQAGRCSSCTQASCRMKVRCSTFRRRRAAKSVSSAAVNAGPGLPPFEVETVERFKVMREGVEKTGDSDDY